MPKRILNNWSIKVLTLASLVVIAACQPSVDERFERASRALAEHDYRSAVIDLKSVLQEEPQREGARLLLADATFMLSDFATAEVQYRRAIEQGNNDAATWIGYGRSLLHQGKATESLEKVSPALEGFADSADAAVLLGDTVAVLGNVEAAIGYYQLALELNSSSERALIGLARAAISAGDKQEAEDWIQRALDAHSESSYVWRSKGDLQRQIGRAEDALDAYEQSVSHIQPSDAAIEQFLARRSYLASLIDLGRFDEAADQLAALESLAPSHPILSFFRGHIAFGRDDYDTAQSELLNYLNFAPNDPRAQAILGAINFSKNSLGQAEEYLSNAVRANVGGDRIRFLLAETQLRLNKPSEARASLPNASSSVGSEAILLAMRARASAGEGDIDTAIDYLEQSIELDGSSESVNLTLAASYLRAGRYTEIIELLEPLPVGRNGDYRREFLLMSAYLQTQQASAAIDIGRKLIAENSGDASAHSLVGVLQESVGNTDLAKQHFDAALAIDPENSGALYGSAVAAIRGNRNDDGIEKLSRLLERNPAHILALAQLASQFEQTGEIELINPRLDAALVAAPDSPALLAFAARVNIVQGRNERALSLTQRAIQLAPDEPGPQYLQGIAYLQNGDLGKAIESLSVAASTNPKNGQYHLDLARAYLMNREFVKSVIAAREYRNLFPAEVTGLVLEIEGLLRSGDPASARDAVQRFAEPSPDDNLIKLLYGDIEMYEGNHARALSMYELYAKESWNRDIVIRLVRAYRAAGEDGAQPTIRRWLAENPDDAEYRRIYGQLLEESGNIAGATEEYEKLLQAGQLDAIGMNNLAWHYSTQDNPDAIEIARQAHELAPGNGSISDTYGWILYQQGEFESAVRILRDAVRNSPANGEIRYHLAAALAASGKTDEAREIINSLLSSNTQFASRTEAEELSRTL